MSDPTIQTFCCHHGNGTDVALTIMQEFDTDAYNIVCLFSSALGILGAIYQVRNCWFLISCLCGSLRNILSQVEILVWGLWGKNRNEICCFYSKLQNSILAETFCALVPFNSFLMQFAMKVFIRDSGCWLFGSKALFVVK